MTAEEHIKQDLQAIFASGDIVFRKLTKGDQPYKFTRWADDQDGRHCLYYQFEAGEDKPEHKKRVPLHELHMALRECLKSEVFRRDMMSRVCPIAHKAGDCGYAVIGGCLEKLGVARFDDNEHEYTLTDKRRAREILG